MKNLFLLSLTFVLILFISPLNAQMFIGPKAGLNIANFSGDDTDFLGESFDSKTGFNGGIFFMYQFSELFAIQPEAYYTMKGATLINRFTPLGNNLLKKFAFLTYPNVLICKMTAAATWPRLCLLTNRLKRLLVVN